jgi:hypothetical protein
LRLRLTLDYVRLYQAALGRYLPQRCGRESFLSPRVLTFQCPIGEGEIHMKSIALVAGLAAALAGCSINGAAPVTAWGKKDVSMLDYRTDGGQCAVLAATSNPDANGANTAGGMNGANGTQRLPPPGANGSGVSSGPPSGAGAAASGTNAPSLGGGMYAENMSPDVVQRAATQQRNAEMAAQRARNDALKSCLVNRGYTEFELTAEQRAQLDKLPQGSEERRAYLYKLGTNPDVLTKQSVKP